jgi:Pyocin activator protein PrtN
MKTAFILLAQYDGRAVIPIELVSRDYFCHLTPTVLVGKITRGEIKLPLVRMDTGQKAARGIHINDLAAWIDARREAAVKELSQMTT